MPVQFRTVFTAQKSPLIKAASATTGWRRFSLFSVISVVLFFLSAVMAFSVFFYRGYIANEIVKLDADLALARKSFEPEFINTAVRLNKRIEAGKQLLSAHRSISPVFEILEKKTLESVRFKSFLFDMKGTSASISMNGEGKSFNSVALQSDIFGGESGFLNPVFSNFSLSERGDVLFNFKADISPELINWGEGVISSASGPSLIKKENE